LDEEEIDVFEINQNVGKIGGLEGGLMCINNFIGENKVDRCFSLAAKIASNGYYLILSNLENNRIVRIMKCVKKD
jgi:hypothetical protein